MQSVRRGKFHYPSKTNVLECICGSLPLATYLNADADAFVDVFCATLIVDTELESVTIFELEWARVLISSREADVIEECARAALGVFDEKFAAGFTPDLRMGAGDDL
jgi:hypothetical protein